MDLTIYDEKLRKAAEVAYSKGGKLISTTWTNSKYNYEFKCKKGHTWHARLDQVTGTKNRKGSWCKTCFYDDKKINIDDIDKIIKDKGGKIITDTTNLQGNSNTIWLEIECKKGHRFSLRISNIKRGSYCNTCVHSEVVNTNQWKEKSKETKENIIEILKVLIEAKNGKFIERKSTSSDDKRLKNFIICENGHLFSKTTTDLKNGEWCSHESCKIMNHYYNLCLCTTCDNFDIYENNYYLSIINDSLRYNEVFDEFIQYSNIYSNEISLLKEKSINRCHTIKKNLTSDDFIPLKFSESKIFNIKLRKHTLETAKQIGKDNNFECLSTEYTGPTSKLEFKCIKGHIFYRSMNDLNSKRFCDKCPKNNYYSIDDIQRIVGEKNGKILSTEFKLVTDVYKWECSKGHIWDAPAHNIIYHDSWCPPCSIYGDKWLISDMKKIANDREGKCLSDVYVNVTTELKWECKIGHQWKSKPFNILDGCWCPDCGSNASYGERFTKQIVNRLFNDKFEKIRPDWLKSSITNYPLELDLYNDNLKLAFEYQGKQHYEFVKRFHGDESNFIKQQRRDIEKKELCMKNNVTLIDVPYTLKFSDIQEYIIVECAKYGINVPNCEPIDINKINVY